jgi:hypothetical protein
VVPPTPAPVAITPAPIATTPAPVVTTPAPVVATATPTMAPAETPAPTMPPVVVTATPTAAPVATPQPTPAPVVTTPAPVVVAQPTPAPVAIALPTTTPIAGTSSPTPGTGECTVTDLILSVALQGGAEFVDPASYQSKALDWLCASNVTGLSDERVVQRYALASIYYATYEVKTVFTDAIFGGAIFPWLDNTNWVTDANECTWTRIGCNDAGMVNVIDLVRVLLPIYFSPV